VDSAIKAAEEEMENGGKLFDGRETLSSLRKKYEL